MRKEIRTEERVIKSNFAVYIAKDGKEFDSKIECEKYEKGLLAEKLEPIYKSLQIKDYEGIAPLDVDEDFPSRGFYWCLLKSKEDYDTIVKYYEAAFPRLDTDYMTEPAFYPALICIMEGDDYVETREIDDVIHHTENFFRRFGYEATIKKIEED